MFYSPKVALHHLLVGFLICVSHASSADADRLRTVALTDRAAPGTGNGIRFDFLQVPSLNDHGQVAFVGYLSGPGVINSNNSGVWSEGDGTLGLLAREGELAPGTEGQMFYLMGEFEYPEIPPIINNAGRTAFVAKLHSGIFGLNGIWSDAGGTGLASVALPGGPAPETQAGVFYSRIEQPRFNHMGQVAFRASLVGEGIVPISDGVNAPNDTGVWLGTGNANFELLFREGDPIPGTSGVSYGEPNDLAINNNGQVAFSSYLQGGGAAILSNVGGPVLPVAIEGEVAPGTAGGEGNQFFLFESPTVNDHGEIAFHARVRGSGVYSSDDNGIWSDAGGNGLQLVARSGEAVPGTPDGVEFAIDPLHQLSFNNRGQLAFASRLDGVGIDRSNDWGIWSGKTGDLKLVARDGEVAPGAVDDARFSIPHDPLLNELGQIAFEALLTGDGVTDANDGGIWAQDIHGALRLVVREGDQVDLSENPQEVDIRTFSRFDLFNGDFGNYASGEGRPSAFNNRGQIAFRAEFTDGTSGIFVSDLIAVPEPISVILVLTGLGMAWIKRVARTIYVPNTLDDLRQT